MAILSDTKIYYDGKVKIPKNFNFLFMVRKFVDKDYWFIDFFDSRALLLAIEDIPNNILNKLRDGSVILYLHNSHEAFHDILDTIYRQLILRLKIPAEHIILASESASIRKEIDRIASIYERDMIHSEWVRMYEVSNAMQKRVARSYVDRLTDINFEKRFLLFNRRWRPHRPLLVALLESLAIRDCGFVSLPDQVDYVDNWNSVIENSKTLLKTQPELIKLLEDNKEKILNIPPLYLDSNDFTANKSLVNDTDYYYLNSLFSIVTETTFFKEFGDAVFLSEKIFKPIFKHHPFIVLARPGTLKALHDAGYETFHPYINEDYDNEEDDATRLSMIVNEVHRLCSLTDSELREFIINVKPICDRNGLVMQNKSLMEDFITMQHTEF